MNDARVCTGGDCEAACPVYKIGGNCPTPSELMAWFRENRESVRLAVGASVG